MEIGRKWKYLLRFPNLYSKYIIISSTLNNTGKLIILLTDMAKVDQTASNLVIIHSVYLHKSDDIGGTQYCRTQQISQLILHLKKQPNSLLSSPVNTKSCPKSQSIHQKRKNLTQQLNHYRWLESRLCNSFTSRTLSKMIRFWICKDQNDSLHSAHHAE